MFEIWLTRRSPYGPCVQKKWPEVFPEFVGRGFFEGKIASGTGEGRCTAKTWYSDLRGEQIRSDRLSDEVSERCGEIWDRGFARNAGPGRGLRSLGAVLPGRPHLEDECEKIEKDKNKGKKDRAVFFVG